MNLQIFDCSNYIYAGCRSNMVIARGIREDNGEFIRNAAPFGGVQFLLKNISLYSPDTNVIMPVFDKTPTIKRQMYADVFMDEYGYKGNRTPHKHKEYIKEQKEFAEFLLRRAGYLVQSADGYEADDIIYTLCKIYKDDFEHIYIHTRDSDLSFLVSDNVEIAKVGELGKVINMDNYFECAGKKGSTTFYNTIHIKKLYEGDSADNIPGVGFDWAPRVDVLLERDDFRKLGDLNFARDILRKAVKQYPNAVNAHRILSTFNIICPLDVPMDLIDDSEQDIDQFMVQYFKSGFNKELDSWGIEGEIEEYIEQYFE